MSRFDRRLEPIPAPDAIKQVDFVMAELRPGKVSIGWKFNGQATCHFFFFDMTPQAAAETMRHILDQEITDKDIARLDWRAVYLPVEGSK